MKYKVLSTLGSPFDLGGGVTSRKRQNSMFKTSQLGCTVLCHMLPVPHLDAALGTQRQRKHSSSFPKNGERQSWMLNKR